MNPRHFPRPFGMAMLTIALMFSIAATAAAQQPATVRIWNFNVHDKKYQQKMYKLFNQRNPNIKIDYTSIVVNAYAQVLEAAEVAKELPELFLYDPTSKLTIDYLRTRKLIMPLSDCAPNDAELKQWMSKFPANLRKFVDGVSSFDGNPYFVDLAGGGGAGYILPLFYNKTVFAEAGIQKPPSTFSELRQTAAKVTSAGAGKYFGITRGGGHKGQWDYDVISGLARFTGWFAQWGGLDPKDGRYHFSSPLFKLGFDVWINLRKDGSVFPGDMMMEDEQAKMSFATNKAALQFGGSWNVGGYYSYNPECDFDAVLAPVPDTGRKGYYGITGTAGAGGYLVPSTAKNPKAVWEVIKFISSLEYQEGWVQGGFGVSYLPEANKPENFLNLPQMYKFVKWTDDAAYFRIVPVPSEDASKVFTTYMPGIYPTHWDVLDNLYQGYVGYEALQDLDKRRDAAFDEGIAKAQAAGVKVTRADFAFPDWDPDKDYVQKKK